MTCIIGLEHNNKVYIGGDSATFKGWDRDIMAHRKVFCVGPCLIGYSGSMRSLNIIQHHVQVRKRLKGETDDHYIITGLMVAIREAIKQHGNTTTAEGRETLDHNAFLVGYHKTLYWVGSEFDVTHYASGMGAVGVGGDFALGALRAQLLEKRRHDMIDPEALLLRALEISAEFSASVAPPFYVECL